MKQVLANKGKVVTENVPTPNISEGCLLIKTVNSCISAGTEMGTVTNTGTPLIKRAMKQPENVKKVLDTVKSQGLAKAYAKVKGELDSGKPIGYSLSGVVIAVGEGVTGYAVGDRVSASGAGLANHAEFVNVPVQLVTKLPDSISFEKASTVTLGAIALQGVRRADLRMGEYAVVFGCGILGLLALQMLKNSGNRVAAVDLDDSRLKLAKELGAEIVINPSNENSVSAIINWSGGYGADAVIFTAATQTSEPLSQSFQMCRKKGKVVLVGVVGMNIRREDMYKNELDFLISTSYGPGRYDNNYEKKGIDYPYAYVRWTQNRNMKEYLRLVDRELIKLEKLISDVYKIEKADEAFQSLKSSDQKPLIVLLDYGQANLGNLLHTKPVKTIQLSEPKKLTHGKINYAIVGAGSFATNMHLPNFQKYSDKFNAYAICDNKGSRAKNIASLFGASIATTDFNEIITDPKVDLVIITTRHDSHASLALQALNAGKHVMVEKPMAVNQSELEKIKAFYKEGFENKPVLFVGFNRRFSKYAREIKKHTDHRINPLFIRYRMNAGFIPLDSWVHEQGGRIVGEACHIIDLMNYFTGARISNVFTESISPSNEMFSTSDNRTIVLKYDDGSVCSIDYFAVGSKTCAKELMEIHFDEKSIILDDFKSIKGYGLKIKSHTEKFSQKGQKEELLHLYDSLTNKTATWPIELWDMIQTTEATFAITNINGK